MLTKQLLDAKSSYEIKSVAGACPESSDFVSLVNAVTRRLMKRGNFFETEVLVRFCIYDCYVVWPSFVGTVLGVRFSKRNQSPIRNSWWSIIGPYGCGNAWTSNVTIRDGNTVPTHNQVTGSEGKLIRYYVEKNPQDIGKTITIYGTKFGGGPLQEQVAGVWRPGITITSAAPFATSTVLVTKITSVVRQATQGVTRLYEYNATDDELRDLAVYYPNETHPRMRSSVVENICAIPYCEDDNGRKFRTLEALVKLQFVDYVNDYDFLFIDDFDALALGIQAIKLEQANATAEAEAKWIQAIREMNYGTRDKQPELQTAIRLNVWGDGSRALVNPI